MNFKRFTLIILILSTLLLSTASAWYVSGDFSCDADVTINKNGLVHVDENFTFVFDEPRGELVVLIPHDSNASVDVLSVRSNHTRVDYKVEKSDTVDRICIYPKDSDFRYDYESGMRLCEFTVTYEMKNAVKIYEDIAGFTYAFKRDDNADYGSSIYLDIHCPENGEHECFVNPKKLEENVIVTDDGIRLSSNENSMEATVLIPLDEFDDDAIYAQHIEGNGKDELKNSAFDWKAFIYEGINLLIKIYIVISCILPIAIYLKYGREPKVHLDSIYEYEPPSDDPPFFVNAMMGGTFKDIGLVDVKAFQATIMDLINRGKLAVEREVDEKGKERTYLIVKSTEAIADYEEELISILRRYEENGRIDLSYMQGMLYHKREARQFHGRFNSWGQNIYGKYLTDDVLGEYFNKKGNTWLKRLAYGGLVLSLVFLFYCMIFQQYDPLSWIVVLFIVSSVLVCIPSSVFGSYTEKGRLYKQRWNNFRKYLKDFSMMKEYPPESVAIWNKYLVYATALGVADEVSKAMKINFYDGLNDEKYRDNDVFVFSDGNGLDLISDSFDAVSLTLDSDNSGSDGVGGGSGGGGGGAF